MNKIIFPLVVVIAILYINQNEAISIYHKLLLSIVLIGFYSIVLCLIKIISLLKKRNIILKKINQTLITEYEDEDEDDTDPGDPNDGEVIKKKQFLSLASKKVV